MYMHFVLLLLGAATTPNASRDDSVTVYTILLINTATSMQVLGCQEQQSLTLNLGDEPWVLTPSPLLPGPGPGPGPFSVATSLLVPLFLFPCSPSILGGNHQHIERGGFPNSNSQSPNPQCPQQRGTLSGTSFSATLRPGWALANPRLSKSRGSLPPTPGLSPVLSCPVLDWTGGFLL